MELRNPKKVVYPLALRVKVVTLAQGSITPSALIAFIEEKGLAEGDIAPSALQATTEERSSQEADKIEGPKVQEKEK